MSFEISKVVPQQSYLSFCVCQCYFSAVIDDYLSLFNRKCLYYTSWINKSQSACPPREAELGRAWQLFPKMRITPTTMITTWKGNNNENGQRPRRLIFTDDLTRPLYRDISTMTGQRRYMSPFFTTAVSFICAAFRWIHIGETEPAHK